MKLLLDTHLLLWAAGEPERLSPSAQALINDAGNELLFSAASLWEIAIKRGLGRRDFQADARLLRRGLLDNGYSELPIVSEHVVATEDLPPIHKDPFDRVLVAQATVEGIALLTIDPLVARYPGPIRSVGRSGASLGHENDHAMRLHAVAFLRQQRKLLAVFRDVVWRGQGRVCKAEPLLFADLREGELELSPIRIGDEMEIITRAIPVQLGQLHGNATRGLAPIRLHKLCAVPSDVEAAFSVEFEALRPQQRATFAKRDHQLKEAQH